MAFFTFLAFHFYSIYNLMRIASVFLVCSVILSACSRADNDSASTMSSAITFSKDTIAVTSAQSDVCNEYLKSFLRWYLKLADPEKPLSPDARFNFKWPVTSDTDFAFAAQLKSENRSTTSYVQMNWASVARYEAMLKRSGYFSSSFLQEKHTSLLQRGKALEAAKIEDGEPEGFEADEIFWLMELYRPQDIDGLKIYSKSGLVLSGTVYELPLTTLPASEQFSFLLFTKSENGHCVLDSIGHLRPEGYTSIKNR